MSQLTKLITAIVILLTLTALASGQRSYDDHVKAAVEAMQAKDDPKAIAEISEAIKLMPNSPDAYFLRSNLYSTAENYDGALADLNRVIELRPNSSAAYYSRAIMHMVRGRLPEAIKDFDQAIAHDFRNDNVYTLRGGLRSQTGDLKGARSDFNEALRLNPNNPRTYLSRAALLMQLSEFDQAQADLDYLLHWYETDPVARPLPKPEKPAVVPPTGEKKEAKDPQDAGFSISMDIATVNEAPSSKEMEPVIMEAYQRRGILNDQRKRYDAAIADLTNSLRLDPKEGDLYFLRARAFEAKQNWEAALKDINKVVELMPKNGNGYVERGVILVMMGRESEAQADFDLLLKSDAVLWRKKIDDRLAEVRKLLAPSPK